MLSSLPTCRRSSLRSIGMALAAASIVLTAPRVARAADIPVATGQSIQAAIQVAQAGDRVLVQPGTYAEAIDFLGLAIEVIGVGGATLTTIDATGLNTSVVTFANGESAAALLQGFTLTGGSGQSAPGATFGGGGVLASNGAKPTLRGCRIVGNTLAQPGHGAGLFAVWQAGAVARVTLEDCVIADNQGRGAEGSLTMRRCTIQGNTDGGVFGASAIDIKHCLFANNSTAGSGGGFAHEFFGVTALVLEHCVFSGNQAGVDGGGASLSFSPFFGGASSVNKCMFVSNTAGAQGGGLSYSQVHDSVFGSTALVRGCTFAFNQGGGSGDAAYVTVSDTSPNTAVVFEHCSLFSNGGSGIAAGANQLLVRDSIVWNQVSPFAANGMVVVSGSDIQGGFVGTGNFDLDPRFVDSANGDLRLRADSPCIDVAGTSAISSDVEGDPQVGIADVGADEFHPHLRLFGVPSPGNTVTLSIIGPPQAPLVFLLSSLTLAAVPTPSPYGPFLLGPVLPLMVAFPALPTTGYIGAPILLPPSLPKATVHLQAFVGFSAANGTFTNAESVRIE